MSAFTKMAIAIVIAFLGIPAFIPAPYSGYLLSVVCAVVVVLVIYYGIINRGRSWF